MDGGSTWACGSCTPGELGLGFTDSVAELDLALALGNYNPGSQAFPYLSGAMFSCALNEYCTDAAVCQNLIKSPLYGQPCPEELPTNGWCGAGLHCISHVCLICEEGTMNSARTRVCLNGQWMNDAWTLALKDPVIIIGLTIVAILGAQLAVFFTCMLFVLAALH